MADTFLVRTDDDEEWRAIEADSRAEAAERYVEQVCDGDSENYGTNPHHVSVFVPGGPAVAFDVEIDWSATFCAFESPRG